MDIGFEALLRHFLAPVLNQFSFDVPLHVCADVSLYPATASQWEFETVKSTAKNEVLLRIIRSRRRSSDLGTLRPEIISTRIPTLSP